MCGREEAGGGVPRAEAEGGPWVGVEPGPQPAGVEGWAWGGAGGAWCCRAEAGGGGVERRGGGASWGPRELSAFRGRLEFCWRGEGGVELVWKAGAGCGLAEPIAEK